MISTHCLCSRSISRVVISCWSGSWPAASPRSVRCPWKLSPTGTDVPGDGHHDLPRDALEEGEKQVTIAARSGPEGLPKPVRMFSHTQSGLSYIILTFDDNAKRLLRASTGARTAAGGTTIPTTSSRSGRPISTAIGEIYRYRVRGKDMRPEPRMRRSRTASSAGISRPYGVADLW